MLVLISVSHFVSLATASAPSQAFPVLTFRDFATVSHSLFFRDFSFSDHLQWILWGNLSRYLVLSPKYSSLKAPHFTVLQKEQQQQKYFPIL